MIEFLSSVGRRGLIAGAAGIAPPPPADPKYLPSQPTACSALRRQRGRPR